MRRNRAILMAVLIISACMTGCAEFAPRPSETELASLDFGEPVSQDFAESDAKIFFEHYLKDPYSAQIQYAHVYRGWVKEPLLNGGKLHYGYVLDVSVNAKNSFGGYVGATNFKFIFRENKVLAVLEEKSGQYWVPVR